MYTLIRTVPFGRMLRDQFPAMMGSLLIAERFYKFHSFTIECIAFLGTWYVLEAGLHRSLAHLSGTKKLRV